MSNKFKTIFLSVALTGFVFSSATAFAGKMVPGVSDTCEQLWLVNDPMNSSKDADTGGGECIDVPVNLRRVKVLFNLDNAIVQKKPVGKDADGNLTFEMNPVGLRHMALLGKVMQHRIEEGLIEPGNIEIVGIFHGPAMSQSKWPFAARKFTAGGMPPEVKKWVHKIFDLQNAGINIQLEVCGVTLKGMQKTMKLLNPGSPWWLMDERAIYSHVHDDDDTEAGLDNASGRIYINQGAVGRIIELQMNGFAYLQEE